MYINSFKEFLNQNTSLITERKFNPIGRDNLAKYMPWIERNIKMGFEIECYAPEDIVDDVRGGDEEPDYDADPDIEYNRESRVRRVDKVRFDTLENFHEDVKDLGDNNLLEDFPNFGRYAGNLNDALSDTIAFFNELDMKEAEYKDWLANKVETDQTDFQLDSEAPENVTEKELLALAKVFAREIDNVEPEQMEYDDNGDEVNEYYESTRINEEEKFVEVKTRMITISIEYPMRRSGDDVDFDELRREVKKHLSRNGIDTSKYSFESDGSLDSERGGIEIILYPPLPYVEAKVEFEKIVKVLRRSYEVDDSTGLHVSISAADLKDINDVDWLKVMVLSGTDYVQAEFNRLDTQYTETFRNILANALGNPTYAQNLYRNKDFNAIHDAIMTPLKNRKYVNINLRGFAYQDGRIEYRVPGGPDMFDTEKVISAINRIILSVAIGHKDNFNMYRKEYIARLYSYLPKPDNNNAGRVAKYKQFQRDSRQAASTLSIILANENPDNYISASRYYNFIFNGYNTRPYWYSLHPDHLPDIIEQIPLSGRRKIYEADQSIYEAFKDHLANIIERSEFMTMFSYTISNDPEVRKTIIVRYVADIMSKFVQEEIRVIPFSKRVKPQ